MRISALFDEKAEELYVDKEIRVGGWARTVRAAQKGALCFVDLYDGSVMGSL